jgi:phosphate:Na+ symporter
MWLMTEGLKLAGGKALKQLLSQWTSNKARALAAGIFITALVQSSSAVTMAALGFVNAGLISFQRTLWVVFGSNVGTTFNAWIVTFFGFSFKLSSITFPLVGIGALIRIFSPYQRGKALGMALAGFALLFLGIDALKDSFAEHAQAFDFVSKLDKSDYATLLSLLTGFILTIMTQSSAAAITIILTAVFSNVVSLESAAAAVIGSNVGTSTTAMVVAIGASKHTKRLALGHILFNLLTGVVALALLPLFWVLIDFLDSTWHITNNPPRILAIFHTAFNVLGVLLMWPCAPFLTRWLLRLFEPSGQSSENQEDEATPATTHLDHNLCDIPDLALGCIFLELKHVIDLSSQLTFQSGAFNAEVDHRNTELRERIKLILKQMHLYIEKTVTSNLTKSQSNAITISLAVIHHLKNVCDLQGYVSKRANGLGQRGETLPPPLLTWLQDVNTFNHAAPHVDEVLQKEHQDQLKRDYQKTKKEIMAMAIAQDITMNLADTVLQMVSLSRRFSKQITRANLKYRALERTIRSNTTTDTIDTDDDDLDESEVTDREAEAPPVNA